MKRHLGLLSVFGVIFFMAMTVFGMDVYINGQKWGSYTKTILDGETGKLEITGTADPVVTANTIKGTISNSTDFSSTIGIPNVTVTLSGDASKTATTGSDGKYTFTGLSDGSYTVTPTKTNYTFSPTSTPVPNLSGNQTATADFAATASKYLTISGIVYDKAGAKLPGATINLKLGSVSLDSMTATDGTYTLIDLIDGLKYTVVATLAGKEFTDCDLDVTINNANVTGINFTEKSTTTGTYTEAINGAKKLNTVITTDGTTPAGFGMGYYQGKIPAAASCKAGKTYFLLDTSWKTNYKLVKWINFALSGPSQTTNFIKLDSNDNGTVIDTVTAKQDAFSIPASGGRYLIEVVSTVAFNLTIWW